MRYSSLVAYFGRAGHDTSTNINKSVPLGDGTWWAPAFQVPTFETHCQQVVWWALIHSWRLLGAVGAEDLVDIVENPRWNYLGGSVKAAASHSL